MGYLNKTVATRNTELLFVQKFIETITEDSHVTCTTTNIESQFSDTSNTPTFEIWVDDIAKFTFTRGAALSNDTASYNITYTVGNQSLVNSSMYFQTFAAGYQSIVDRIVKLRVVSNPQVVYVEIASCTASVGIGAGVKCIAVTNGTVKAAAGTSSTSTYAVKTAFFTSSGNAMVKRDKMNYIQSSGNPAEIEYIKTKSFVSTGSGIVDKVFDLSKMYDTSIITADTTYVIGGTKYYALDSSTLMEVST